MQEINSAPLDPGPSSQSRRQSAQRSRSSQWTKILSPAPVRQIAPLNSNCFVCGAQNANGLRLTFEPGSNGVHATWVPKHGWESFQGTVHGGIITAVLDEAMSQAIIDCGWEAFTVDLKVRFHDRVSPGEQLRVEGWVVEKRKRRILAESNLTATDTKVRAHAWATFLVPPGERLC